MKTWDQVKNKLTDRVKKAVCIAGDLADEMNNEYVGTEHLLIGLMKSDGVATKVLLNLGLTIEKIEAETKKLLGYV